MRQTPTGRAGASAPISLLTAIVLTGLLAGSLDALAATLNFWIHGQSGPERIWRYVASAALGPSARTGGVGIVALGLLFHYIIAFCWTILYFALYPKLPALSRNFIVSGLLYGIVVWLIMNLAVVPLSRIGKFPSSTESIITNMGILMVAIGLPVAGGARWYYTK